ncbi:MAG: UDP-N-acetylmuramoyl-tripeptide--D-alanyl-D-alanine ligase [Bacteroidota bacterium]|jgi:UDP-N-acetylmuramoyl-tripeptide--D-alanyl-D-alanine ligase
MMKKISIKDLRSLSNAEVLNKETFKGRTISGVSTDSRTAGKNEIFFALKGEKFDAHDFVADLLLRGAAGIVVNAGWAEKNGEKVTSCNCVCVIVPDTTRAYGELARIYRKKFDIPVVAIAGSNGKTTTKEMVTAVLRSTYTVLATEGNLNNHIGVPQTLFRLDRMHEIAVVEIGTNHFGELKYLCELAEPTHGLITNIGKEHLEFFGDEEGVAKEETELFRYLEKNNGTAFINYDDPFLFRKGGTVKKSIGYGINQKADIRAKKIQMDELGRARFECVYPKKSKKFHVALPVPGLHNAVNALAAISVGLKLKVKEKRIISAVKHFSSAAKRMEVLSQNGITLLNDTYNSNPDSVIAALKTLASVQTGGRKFVVLGDMKELGESSKREHTNIGAIASGMNFHGLFAHGPFSKYTSEAFGSGARHFDSKDDLSSELKKILHPGDVVLIKGSRGMKMEEVVHRLLEQVPQQSMVQ